MKYQGSKNRIAKHILPIMLEARGSRCWVEPFVGGANMIDKVGGRRIGADSNKYMISLFKAVQNGFSPPEKLTEEEYNYVKEHPEYYLKAFVGFVGVGCSYGGKWMGGYARSCTKGGLPRNHCLESKSNLMKQADSILEVEFIHCSYENLNIPHNSLIYCDPPYANSTGYWAKFDSAAFWAWCRQKTQDGHLVYVSEYEAPKDFKCLYSKEVNSSLTKNTGAKKAVEKLFTYELPQKLF